MVLTTVACLSISLAVRLSVTCQHCLKMDKLRITQATSYVSPGTSSFLTPNILVKFESGHHHGATNARGVG